jgi:hypothetical protein
MEPGVAVRICFRLTAALVAFSLVAACGNEKSEPSVVGMAVGSVAKSALGKVKGKRGTTAPAKAAAPVTRADLEKYGVPILRAKIPVRGADALVTPTDTKGNVVTWSTTDGTTFTLRDGVLIQTRGLGPDLMSAQAPTAADLARDGGTHQRIYYYIGEDDRSTRRAYDCTMSAKGQDVIEIFGRSHKVTHMAETCVRPQGSVTNDFWLEGATTRKSRQLASGGVGFIEFELVID